MGVTIRKATIEDCNKLSYLKRSVYQTTYRGIYSSEEIDKFDVEKHQKKFEKNLSELYVIVFFNETVGYFSFGKPKYAYKDYNYCLNSLYILKEYQRRGLGREVFNFIDNFCSNNNINRYFVCCNKYNLNALNFYKKMGGYIAYLQEEENDKSKHQYYIEFNK